MRFGRSEGWRRVPVTDLSAPTPSPVACRFISVPRRIAVPLRMVSVWAAPRALHAGREASAMTEDERMRLGVSLAHPTSGRVGCYGIVALCCLERSNRMHPLGRGRQSVTQGRQANAPPRPTVPEGRTSFVEASVKTKRSPRQCLTTDATPLHSTMNPNASLAAGRTSD